MGREYYEDESNLNDEQTVAKHLERHSPYEFDKLPLRYEVDWAVLNNGELAQFMEFKRRHNNLHTYDTFFISLGKVKSGLDLARMTGAEFVIMVQFDDCLAYHKVSVRESGELPYRMEWGGRFDRSDDQDSEIMVHIPSEDFETVRSGVVT